jgi:uncharacterized repeat protein (TIGR03806 family)
MRFLFAALVALLIASCSEVPQRPAFFAEDNPQHLSEWGALDVSGGSLTLGEGVAVYTLNTPLFTDYAQKLRTIWMLKGRAAAMPDGSLDFPIGTVITKTFYYPTDGQDVIKAAAGEELPLDLSAHRLLETRLLVRRRDGWHPVSYVWNDEQTDASLKRTGAVIPLQMGGGGEAFAYVVPNENQCASCHAPNATTANIQPLGPTVGQLNKMVAFQEDRISQLDMLEQQGMLTLGAGERDMQVAWDDKAASLDARARSYLASNCAHCHNPQGPADTSGLDLTLTAEGAALGRCKPPIAAGSGTGGRRFDITPGSPGASILTYRVASTDPGAMMPELGRSLVHEEGLALLEAWIGEMEGGCG